MKPYINLYYFSFKITNIIMNFLYTRSKLRFYKTNSKIIFY